jgi:hypothetical protein
MYIIPPPTTPRNKNRYEKIAFLTTHFTPFADIKNKEKKDTKNERG